LGKAKKAIYLNRYRAMNEQFRNELEQRLNNLQSTVQRASFQEISKELEDLFERSLVAEFIELRNKKKSEIFERVASVISNLPPQPVERVTPQPEPASMPKAEAKSEANPYPMNPEIKVLATPEGPPMPSSNLQDEETQFEESAKILEEVAPPPPPRKPISDPEPIAVKGQSKPAPVLASSTSSPNPVPSIAEKAQQGQKQTSLHQRLAAKNLSFGLNDRIAYIKHLFEGSAEDFNRVVNQLNTYENWQEAEGFIAEMVKPDYNWGGKEEYETRFIAQVKTRFEA
jgi:hypothetical protein